MTISYPLSLPSGDGIGLVQVSFSAVAAIGRNENRRTFQTQIYEHSGQKLRAQVTWVRMTAAGAKTVRAFLLSLLEGEGTCLIGDPVNATPAGANVGTPLTNGSSNAIGNRSVNTKGWTISTTDVLKAGDDIQISNYLYTLLQDINSDGSGNAVADIFPALRTAPTDGTAITTVSPKGLFRLESSQVGWSTSEQKVYDISAVFTEAI